MNGWILVKRTHLSFLLGRFATKERDGLLLYNGRFNERHDFVALEIIQEQVQLTFSAGMVKLRPTSSQALP